MDRERLLSRVSRPARYLGGEANQVRKDPARVRLTFALAFPEVYEIAMSHQGLKILYHILASRPEVAAERVFMPWIDLMELMERRGVAPWSLESGRPLDRFDVIGFSLQYELTYTNLLHMLRLAGIPLRREERGPDHPLVIAGGPCLANPEPLAEFLDLAVIGEAEELIHELVDLLLAAKEEGWDRPTLYARAATIKGVYVPALYRPRYQDGRLVGMEVSPPAPQRVRRRVVADLAQHPPPTRPVVPLVKPVHDRLGLEIARGCTRGCRFCSAGYFYRPVRERPPAQVLQAALEGLAATGHQELALLSLSAGDYACIEPLAAALMDVLAPRRWSLSLPSLRLDSLGEELIAQIKRVRKSGFTLAPEAGSTRLRRVINKDLSREQILQTTRRVFELGWNLVKLYFMVGLPTESESDLEAIGELCAEVAAAARAAGRGRGRRPVVHASLGVFVPKPHTPFQWEAQLDLDEARRRLQAARRALDLPRVRAKWNDPAQSLIEGVLSRGDRRLARALELAVAAGCRFDGWSEHLRLDTWLEALARAGLSPEEYLRARDPDEVLPWDHIDLGVSKEFLLRERQRARAEQHTPDCRLGPCQDCGVCDHRRLKPRPAQPEDLTPPPPPPPAEPTTYRFRLEKTGPARFLGHLEMISQIVRAFQRAGVRLAFSQGFHPHPLVKTASALPVGVESLVETLSVTVLGSPPPQELEQAVNARLPEGLRLADGRRQLPGEGLAEPEEVTYLVQAPRELDPARLEQFQRQEALLYRRTTPKGTRTIDLKGALKRMRLREEGLEVVVGRAGGRPKPAEILEGVFGLSPEEAAHARALKIAARHPAPAEGGS